jgi:hypothetical protein
MRAAHGRPGLRRAVRAIGSAPRDEREAQRGGMRSAPSSRIVSPLSIRFSTI